MPSHVVAVFEFKSGRTTIDHADLIGFINDLIDDHFRFAVMVESAGGDRVIAFIPRDTCGDIHLSAVSDSSSWELLASSASFVADLGWYVGGPDDDDDDDVRPAIGYRLACGAEFEGSCDILKVCRDPDTGEVRVDPGRKWRELGEQVVEALLEATSEEV